MGSTMTATSHGNQLGAIYPVMLNEFAVNLALEFHVFIAVAIMVCGRHGLWPSWFVAVMVCGRHGLWPSWFVAVMV